MMVKVWQGMPPCGIAYDGIVYDAMTKLEKGAWKTERACEREGFQRGSQDWFLPCRHAQWDSPWWGRVMAT